MKTQITYRTNNAVLQEEVTTFIRNWKAGITHFTVQTSGSTGAPNQILLTRKQLIASANRTLEYFQLKPGNTCLLGISPSTIGGKMLIVRAILGDLELIVTDPSSLPTASLTKDETLDFCPLVPLQIQQMLQQDPQLFKRIKTILIGGSPLSPSLEQALLAVHSNSFIGFGMTETVSHVALRKLGEPYYHALSDVEFSSQNGQLVITDPSLNIDHLITTDLINLIDSRTFEWLGRSDFAINSGGIKLHPEQLEQRISEIISGFFFIAGEPDDTFGQTCIIVVDESATHPTLELIQIFCKEQIGKYTAPKKLYKTTILFNSGSKINRKGTLQQLGIEC